MAVETIPTSLLSDWSESILIAAGASRTAARSTAASLVEASLRGIDTHGLVLLPGYARNLLRGEIDGHARPSVIAETASVSCLDGRNGIGAAIASESMALAISKAEASGFGAAIVSGANHFGAAAVYANQAARAGCLGIVMANGPAAMAPAGALRPVLSTNPIALAAPGPGGDGPLPSFDMATTRVAMGKIYAAKRRGEPIPDDWATGPDGQPTTNPSTALEGVMLPMAGHKGFGLALFVEIFTACLGGGELSAEICADGAPGTTSMFLGALSVDALDRRATFAGRLGDLLAQVSSTPVADGVGALRAPGERAARSAVARERAIPLETEVYESLRQLGEEVQVPVPEAAAP